MTGKEKAVAAAILTVVIGVLGQIVALNLISGSALHVTQVVLAGLTALTTTFGVYLVPNTPPT